MSKDINKLKEALKKADAVLAIYADSSVTGMKYEAFKLSNDPIPRSYEYRTDDKGIINYQEYHGYWNNV